MSKHRKYPRQPATAPKQLQAQEAIHHERKVNVVVDRLDGTKQTMMITEAQLMEIQRTRQMAEKSEEEIQ